VKYDLKSSHDIAEAQRLLAQLTVDKKVIELKEVKPRRSLNQNAFLHLLLGAFGANLGYSVEEAKELYKRLPGNKELYAYQKDVGGKPMTFLRSSADLNKEEMTRSIETLREWSAKMGYPLPTAEDREWLMRIENEIEKHERYL